MNPRYPPARRTASGLYIAWNHRVETRLDARVEAAGNELAQAGPVKGEEPVEGGLIAGADRVQWVDDPARGWEKADAVINTWRLPCP